MNAWFLMGKLVAKYNMHSWILLAYTSKVNPLESSLWDEYNHVCLGSLWMFGTLYVGVAFYNPPKEGPKSRPFKTKGSFESFGLQVSDLLVWRFQVKRPKGERKNTTRWQNASANGRLKPHNKFHLTTSIRMCGQNLHVKNFPNQNSQPQEKTLMFHGFMQSGTSP